jgi:glycosyltransferase involved in cell wall biosynthesis
MDGSRIKILFLIDELVPGGTEKQLILLAENLPREDFDPVIGVLEESEYRKKLDLKTPIVDLKCSGPPVLKELVLISKVRRYLDRQQFHMVQTHLVESAILGAWAVRLSKTRPYLIGTRRNLYHWVEDEPWTFIHYRLTGRWAQRVLVNSCSVMQMCKNLEKIPFTKVKLIHNGVEIDKFNGVSSEVARANIGLDDEFPIIGVVANWRPIKGLITFLKAAVLVAKHFPSSRFVLAGFGQQKDDLLSFSQKLGIRDRVVFLEGRRDVHEIIPAFNVAVQSSLSESLSNVLLEYMASARPIVATRVGDSEMIIEQDHDGLLVSPDSSDELGTAILELCHNREKAAELGRLAREKVMANWSLEIMLKNYKQFYHHVVQQNRDRV